MDSQGVALVQELALAALLHDVGKFAQRAEADPERYAAIPNLGLFCVSDQSGAVRYHHAAYTWQFIEDNLPWLINRAQGGEQNLAGWAARHHKPSSTFDWIVAEADRLSAGMDRGHPDESLAGWTKVQSARLEPLAVRIRSAGRSEVCAELGERYEFALRELEFADAIFAKASSQRSQPKAAQEYRALFERFAQRVRQLPSGDIARFFVEFLSVYEQFTWCVPAATATEPRDVSLFEHSRAASAIAAALAYELIATNSFDESSARNRAVKRYALMVGDLSGIQNFIYTVASTKAARALRGRSLALQLLTDAIAQTYLASLELPPSSLLYNGGGRIWMLLPLCLRGEAERLCNEIDLSLIEARGGQLGFNVGFADMSGEDFVQKQISDRWDEAVRHLARRRLGRLRKVVTKHYTQLFAPRGDPARERPCGVCGSLSPKLIQLAEDDEGVEACDECDRFIKLGGAIPRARTIVRLSGETAKDRALRFANSCKDPTAAFLPEPQLLSCAYLVSAADAAYWQRLAASDDTVFTINAPPNSFEGNAKVSFWLLGINKNPSTFEELAQKSTGIARLGVLRMDVDSLGDIFWRGFSQHERTFSRLTNLSKTLSYFFAGYLTHLATSERWSQYVQIIYSGGDDLFVVGPWSEIAEFAREVRSKFDDFVCHNSHWGLSGAIAIVQPKYPVAAAAEQAGELERKAKQYRRGDKFKDALAFLDDALGWDELEVARELAHYLKDLLQASGEEQMPRAVLHKLADIARMYRESLATLPTHGSVSIQELTGCAMRGRWAWTAAYTLSRAARTEGLRCKLDLLADALHGAEFQKKRSAREVIYLLKPAVAWADYLTRKKERR